MNHGTLAMYTTGACRCPDCKRVANRHVKQWRVRKHQGYEPMVDAKHIRRHVQQLLDQGMSFRGIALTAGYRSRNSLESALSRKRVMRKVHDRIMAVTVDKDTRRFGYVDSTGPRRRLQALMALGWPSRVLAVRIGAKDHGSVLDLTAEHNQTIRRATAEAIKAVYDELWDQQGPSRISAQRAAKRGWFVPLAWDDDSIDDPAAIPDLGADHGRRHALAHDFIDTQHEHGGNVEAAAVRLGVTWGGLTRALYRARKDGVEVDFHNGYKSGRAAA